MNSETQEGNRNKQGLYDPAYEHGACGIGFVVNIKGEKSNKTLSQGLEALVCLNHRGALGSELNTGDGAGILLQLPHTFLRHVCKGIGIDLPREGYYGVGMVFFSKDDESLLKICKQKFEGIVNEEGQKVLGWRAVPTEDRTLGPTAKSSEPRVLQVFIGRGNDVADDLAFERKLYIIRKRASNIIRYGKIDEKFCDERSSQGHVQDGHLYDQVIQRCAGFRGCWHQKRGHRQILLLD